jgi:hypothetical protein
LDRHASEVEPSLQKIVRTVAQQILENRADNESTVVNELVLAFAIWALVDIGT